MLNKKNYEMGSKSNDDFTVAMVSLWNFLGFSRLVDFRTKTLVMINKFTYRLFKKKVIESVHFLNFADSTEINEEMFVKFWTFFNKLFMKLDRNNG